MKMINAGDNLTPSQRSKCMSHIRSKNTKIEVVLRRALWQAGYRYRKNCDVLPGKPDIAIMKHKIAIFCDGEFFHGKGWFSGEREHVARGATGEYWTRKIERNMARDDEVDRQLNELGWTVLRFWGKEILKHPETCIKAIEECILEKQIAAYDVVDLEELEECVEP